MIEKSDLDAAVRNGALSQHDADRLRRFVEKRHSASAADDEHIAMVGGLGDVMIAVALLLTAAGIALGMRFSPIVLPLYAPLAWATAEYVTRVRRLPLSSGLLLVLFGIGSASLFSLVAMLFPGAPTLPRAGSGITGANLPPLSTLLIAYGTAMACFLYWLRFRLPLAFAATVMALINVAVHAMRLVFPTASAMTVSIVLLCLSLGTFALAMRWDISDVYRQTRRSDVAFWLHAMAGFQLAAASFRLVLGLKDNPVGWDRLYSFAAEAPTTQTGLAVIAIFTVFVFVAIAVDRRSLLMSSLVFVVPAAGALFMAGSSLALASVGLGLLTLALKWGQIRALVVSNLPMAIRSQLPRAGIEIVGPRPIL